MDRQDFQHLQAILTSQAEIGPIKLGALKDGFGIERRPREQILTLLDLISLLEERMLLHPEALPADNLASFGLLASQLALDSEFCGPLAALKKQIQRDRHSAADATPFTNHFEPILSEIFKQTLFDGIMKAKIGVFRLLRQLGSELPVEKQRTIKIREQEIHELKMVRNHWNQFCQGLDAVSRRWHLSDLVYEDKNTFKDEILARLRSNAFQEPLNRLANALQYL
eukprot:maker-scaffold4015_size6909-snap-gene-0.7 protein:Tk04138 transcript:maker-scaffold4015_size6909-snap-gene-0.7-mRNA-1 annotation:"hypothetical protein"